MFSSRAVVCTLALFAISFSNSSAFAKVEAVKGKRYTLTKQHGPWMINVATFQPVPMNRRIQGLSPWEAADELVYELRKLGIPAYTFLMNEKMGELKEFSADAAKGDEKKFIAQHEAIGVLAGNFGSMDDKNAIAILDYLKNDFDPAFLNDKNNGGIIAKTPGRPKPLSRAFMTTNPLRDPEDIKRNSMDPFVKRLNSDMEYSLLKNKGKYTLRIATFEGNSITQMSYQEGTKAQQHFDKMMGDSLSSAGDKAWELTEVLRSARKLGYDRDFDAYVFHDRYKSIVTVGSFDSPSDPRIAQLAELFRGKQRIHEGNEVTTAEVFTIPKNLKQGVPPDKMWMFDIRPKLESVPQAR